MLDLSSLQYNSEYPGLLSIAITVLSSMLLGVLLAFTYEKTSRDVNRAYDFLQALILVTIVAATVIQAIGDSVARGLGMIGALSIIRFRTTVSNPRNIVFMFSAIAVGIACGVFGILIAVVGTIGFSLTAFLLHYSSFSPRNDFIGKLKLELDTSIIHPETANQVLDTHCQKKLLKKTQVDMVKGVNFTYFFYDLKLKKKTTKESLLQGLLELDGVAISKFGMERNTSSNI